MSRTQETWCTGTQRSLHFIIQHHITSYEPTHEKCTTMSLATQIAYEQTHQLRRSRSCDCHSNMMHSTQRRQCSARAVSLQRRHQRSINDLSQQLAQQIVPQSESRPDVISEICIEKHFHIYIAGYILVATAEHSFCWQTDRSHHSVSQRRLTSRALQERVRSEASQLESNTGRFHCSYHKYEQ